MIRFRRRHKRTDVDRFATLVPYDGDVIDPDSTPYESGLADARKGRVDLISRDFDEDVRVRDEYRRGLRDGM